MSEKKEERREHIEEDYNLSRFTYTKLLKMNTEILSRLKEIAEESEHPKPFEVFSTMSKQTADIADKLMELQRKKQVVDTEDDLTEIAASLPKAHEPELIESQVVDTTENHIEFTGTPAELLKVIEEKENGTESKSNRNSEPRADKDGTESP